MFRRWGGKKEGRGRGGSIQQIYVCAHQCTREPPPASPSGDRARRCSARLRRATAAGRVGAAPYADEEGVASVRRRAPEAPRGPGIKKVVRTFPPAQLLKLQRRERVRRRRRRHQQEPPPPGPPRLRRRGRGEGREWLARAAGVWEGLSHSPLPGAHSRLLKCCRLTVPRSPRS